MNIVAHRGLFRSTTELLREANSRDAIVAAFDAGFGVETDVRDLAGELVISHDPPRHANYTFDEFLADWRTGGHREFALNVKSSGIAPLLVDALTHDPADAYYAFDLAFPDLLSFTRAGLTCYTRLSDYETELLLLDDCVGVWVDGFDVDPSNPAILERIETLLDANKRVCLVSPELHRRDHHAAWAAWSVLADHPGLSICTDFPFEAVAAFGVAS